ncbi:MAG: hypothetical protein HZA16_03730 [Nitrospirae bacterium]|nr:hypothetical protein [Nitrospirota bacterium]
MKILMRRHSRSLLSGNPWFDRLAMTSRVTLSLSKGGCPIKNFGHDKKDYES